MRVILAFCLYIIAHDKVVVGSDFVLKLFETWFVRTLCLRLLSGKGEIVGVILFLFMYIL